MEHNAKSTYFNLGNMNMPEDNESILIEAAINGDETASAELIGRYHARGRRTQSH